MKVVKQTYLWITLDPVHIGTGGYRLGRVDLSITREPGTNLPKIPGTSLSGAARSYAAMRYESIQCAGQGGHCTKKSCPVCYTFGSLEIKDEETQHAYAGTVNIFDAHLLLFPVHSMVGPVWVTSPQCLKLAGIEVPVEPTRDKLVLSKGVKAPQKRLNLGWLLLEAMDQKITLENQILQGPEWKSIQERVVLVSDKLFGQIVNANLEVRTSVSINPETGTAEEGALFTYEAIPRSALLVSDVIQDDFRGEFQETETTAQGNALSCGAWKQPLDVLHAGLVMIEYLGVGGMGTRGFGRMRVVGEPIKVEV